MRGTGSRIRACPGLDPESGLTGVLSLRATTRNPVHACNWIPDQVRDDKLPVGLRHLPVDVVPAAAFAHEAAYLMQALRAAMLASASNKLDDAGVARLFGVAHFEAEPFQR